MSSIRARQLTFPRPHPMSSTSVAAPAQAVAPVLAEVCASSQTQPTQHPQRNLPVPQALTNPTASALRTVTNVRQPISQTIDSTDDQLTRALRENQVLADRLLTYEQANTAFSNWAEMAKNQLAAHKTTIDQLTQEVTRLNTERVTILARCGAFNQELEGYKATNAELRSQVGDLMTRNSAVNASAIRFRQDLWHSEMRWRDSLGKLSELRDAAKKLAGKFCVIVLVSLCSH
jgi:chromosome segregation ATPase